MKKMDYLSSLSKPLGDEADLLKSKIQIVIRDLGLNLLSASKKMGLDSFAILNDFYKKIKSLILLFLRNFVLLFAN